VNPLNVRHGRSLSILFPRTGGGDEGDPKYLDVERFDADSLAG